MARAFFLLSASSSLEEGEEAAKKISPLFSLPPSSHLAEFRGGSQVATASEEEEGKGAFWQRWEGGGVRNIKCKLPEP